MNATETRDTGAAAEPQMSPQLLCLLDAHAALRELSASLAQQKVEIAALQKQNQEQAEKLKDMEQQKLDVNRLKQQRRAEQVAFSASLLAVGDATTGPFPSHTTLVFKNVLTNFGNAYNPDTGVFTAPVRGLYHFQWHIGGNHGSAAAVLVKNTNHIFVTYGVVSDGYGTSSQSASLLLEARDAVFVRQWEQSRIHDNQNHHTTFSGHLLFSLAEETAS